MVTSTNPEGSETVSSIQLNPINQPWTYTPCALSDLIRRQISEPLIRHERTSLKIVHRRGQYLGVRCLLFRISVPRRGGGERGAEGFIGFTSRGEDTANHNVYHGERCLVQDNSYDPHKREARLQKRSAPTTSGTSREPEQKKQRNEEESQEDATTHAGPSEQSEQKQQEKGKEKESKEWAVPKLYAILYNDDEEETLIAEPTQNQDEIIQSLRAQLDQAQGQLDQVQGKVVLLAATLEKVHRTAHPLSEQLRSGVRLMRKVGDSLGIEKGKELTTFVSENTAVVRAIMDPMNAACEELDRVLPRMAQRVFIHDANEPTDGMKNWIEASATNYEKLRDDKDKVVNSQGKQC